MTLAIAMLTMVQLTCWNPSYNYKFIVVDTLQHVYQLTVWMEMEAYCFDNAAKVDNLLCGIVCSCQVVALSDNSTINWSQLIYSESSWYLRVCGGVWVNSLPTPPQKANILLIFWFCLLVVSSLVQAPLCLFALTLYLKELPTGHRLLSVGVITSS